LTLCEIGQTTDRVNILLSIETGVTLRISEARVIGRHTRLISKQPARATDVTIEVEAASKLICRVTGSSPVNVAERE